MFSNPLAGLLRALVALAILAGAALLAREWLDALPRERVVVGPAGPVRVPLVTTGERLDAWDPGGDRATAYLAGALALLFVAFAGRLVSPRLWRKSGHGRAGSHAKPAARHQKVTARGGPAIAVDEYGPADGQAVLLVHGLGCDHRLWREAVEDLSEDFRVLTMDLSGHGRSGHNRSAWTVEALADDIDAVIRHAGADGLVLVGHSMGGMAAMTWVAGHAREARALGGLVLVHTTPRNPYATMHPEPLHRSLQKPAYEPLLRVTRALAFLVRLSHRLEYWNGSLHWQAAFSSYGGSETREQLDRAARFQADLDPAVAARLTLASTRWDVRPRLRSIRVPTVVIAAEKDPVTKPDASREIAGAIPDARLVTLPATRHLGFVERRDGFAEVVRGFRSAPGARRSGLAGSR